MMNYCYDEQFYDLSFHLSNIEDKLQKILEIMMDKQIRKIEKDTKKVQKGLKNLEKLDKKRDPYCEAGEKMMKDKKK